jgi:tRNA G37 N-methylase Trm5
MSATPEALALELAREMKRELNPGEAFEVVDAGCGVGGNAIGFAREGARVLAFERDPERAEMARRNASLYGVGDAIDVRVGDAVRAVDLADPTRFLFLDPPWGEHWNRVVTTARALPLLTALWSSRSRWRQVWAKLPPSFDPSTLEGITRVRPWFGVADGDNHRVKFVSVES